MTLATPIDFFVIGAMKAATTGMCDWLDAQPGVALSQPKEPMVFVSDDALRHWGPRLATLFEGASPGDLRGEGSTDYAKHPHVAGVPARVRAVLPDAKLVYLMRHPVSRTISQHRFDWMRGGPTMTFEQALERSPGLIDFSRYAFQLHQWLEHFPAEQLLLVFTEAFAADPPRQVRRVLEFLGVDNEALCSPPSDRSNETDMIVRQSRPLKLLRESRLGKSIKPLVPPRVIEGYKARMREKSQPEVTEAAMSRMLAAYDEDLRELSRLLHVPQLTCATWNDVVPTLTPRLHTN